MQHAEFEVVGAEVVAPLRHAMRLVDREQCNAHALQDTEHAFLLQPLRRDVQQVELAANQLVLDARGFVVIER